MSLINTKVKPFKNQAFKNGKFVEITEKNIEGNWSVFFFYPANFTFVCPTELEDMADYYEKFQEIGVSIYSISTDTHFSHKVWHDVSKSISKIKYTMIGDPTGSLSKDFDVFQESTGLANRGTFIIDSMSIIQSVEIIADGIGRNASELFQKVKAIQYVNSHSGEVCPAKWKEGSSTLSPSINLVGKI